MDRAVMSESQDNVSRREALKIIVGSAGWASMLMKNELLSVLGALTRAETT